MKRKRGGRDDRDHPVSQKLPAAVVSYFCQVYANRPEMHKHIKLRRSNFVKTGSF